MKKGRKIVEKYEETQEEFWVRKILWSDSVIEKEGKELSWNNFNKIMHISIPNFSKHKEFFREKIGKDMYDKIMPSKAKIEDKLNI